MKKSLIIAGMAALGLGVTVSASANEEFEANCNQYVEDFDRTELDCSCLAGKVSEDPSLLDEFNKVTKPEDVELLNDDAQGAVMECSGDDHGEHDH